jgi:hypothetical protein
MPVKKILLALSFLLFLSIQSFAGPIKNAKYDIVGYIESDGTIKNAKYDILGYAESGGTIKNAKYDIVGYIESDGTIKNARYDILGYAESMPRTWTAAYFFFFRSRLTRR